MTVLATPAESVTLSQTTASLKVGETVSLTATVLPANATDKTVTWSSSNPAVATVDANGKVTAVALGNATITAKCGSVSATCSVTVVATPAESVTLNQTSASLKVGESVSLTATVLPADATDKTVTWSSSNTSVAIVDSNGKVTAIALGSATITAKCGSVSASCSVTVVATPAESITLSQTTASLKVGEIVSLTATVLPANTTDKTISWSSSNPAIASVDANGKVSAVALGNATITAKCGSVSATCSVTVVATPAESVTLSQTSASLKVGESVSLTATVLPANATDKTVTWSSSNPAVATVDANGKVTAVALGNATITAKCGSVSATCSVTVVATPAESVTINHTSASLKVGETVSLTATVLPVNTTDKTVTWSSSNPAIATVDANGKVTAVALGNTTITAKCGSVSATCSVTVVATPAESVTLSQTSASLKVGETVSLTATVLPANSTDKTVTWTSSNTAVATVDANGKVTAVALGSATITAKCGSVSATCSVTVVATPAESVTLSQTTASLKVGESVSLTATVLPANTTDKTVTWTSSNPAVATVDANGKVTAVALGNTTITAKCGSVSATCSMTVVATPAESVTLNQTSASLKVGETVSLIATVLPANATDKTVTWSSSNPAVATVDANGKVTAIALGNTTITAKCGSVSASCSVTVVATPAESVTINQTSAQLKVGEIVSLTATVLPANATGKTVTWSSSNPEVATVDANGKVTAIALGSATITAKCGSVSASCSVTVVATPAESVTLNQTSASLKVGESVSLTATVLPADATDKTVTWSSSNTAVATVDANGKVTAVALGNAVITAKCGSVSATCSVTVVATPAESVTLSQTSASLKVGESVSLTATVLPANATDKTVTWSSSNPAVATVDSNGKVTAVALGNAIITAKCGSVSATCSVTVVATPAESVTLSQTSAQLKVGETVSLTATVLPANATDKTVTWSSSNTAVATVDANGKVTAVALGNAIITAKCGSVSATCSVTVVATPAESITLNQTSASLKVGETVSLTATVLPANATDKTVTWSSSNTAVATVDANGKITAVALGNATITAKCGSISATCSVTVVATPAETVTLNQTTASLKVGETVSLTATVLPATTTDKTVSWSSSNPAIVTVDANGKVTAVALGNAVITAKCGSVSATCSVTVVATPAESVTLSQNMASLKVGETVSLTATVLPADATDKTVTWSSSNPAVATVDSNGKVTAVALGEATIKAKCGSVSASCSVTVVATPAESVTLSPTTASLKVGETVSLTATVLPANATDKTVTWTSSNSAVATVDANGKVTAVALGDATITAKCGSVSATCSVTVVATPAESVTLNQTSASLKVGESVSLTATVLPADATDKTITWSSSNTAVATVDANGKVTAVALGNATITAQCGEVSASCEVTVLPILVEEITLSFETWSGVVGDCVQLTGTVFPENATDKSLDWTSSNDLVATVDNTGLVTIRGEGTCVITASANDGSGVTAQCVITGQSGIEEILSDSDAKVDIYNLSGILLKRGCDKDYLRQLTPGAYIVRQGQRAVKMIKK